MNTNNTYLINDFSNLTIQQWQIVNDSVMGGVSHSHLQILDSGRALFSGTVSLKNNGGFASVKNSHRLNLSGYSVLNLRLKGDGNRYSFRFRTEHDGIRDHWVYEMRFDTESHQWQQVHLPLSNFRAVRRGTLLNKAPSPDLSNIIEYWFLISDKQEGNFRLEIEKISVF